MKITITIEESQEAIFEWMQKRRLFAGVKFVTEQNIAPVLIRSGQYDHGEIEFGGFSIDLNPE